jgi:cation transport ATPase
LNLRGFIVDLSKVGYGFLIILALTLNFSFFLGEFDNTRHHQFMFLVAAACMNIISTYFIFKHSVIANEQDTSKGKEILFASGLVAALQLCLAIVVWVFWADFNPNGALIIWIISLSGGALIANLVTTCFVVLDTLIHRDNSSK